MLRISIDIEELRVAVVEFRPGDTLTIICPLVHETPFGTKKIESNFELSYEDLLRRLEAQSQGGKTRKLGTNGTRFSRMVSLSFHALHKGTWATGASIDRRNVFAHLIDHFQALQSVDYSDITTVAKKSLCTLQNSSDILTPAQKRQLQEMLDALGLSS
jgi:hypothetical protein